MRIKKKEHLRRDKAIVAWSILVAGLCWYGGVFTAITIALADYLIIGNFVAGMMFTSVFTVAPSVAAFAEFAKTEPLIPMIFAGGLGAVVGDLLLYLFVRDALSDDIALMVSRRWKRRLGAIFHHPWLRWMTPIVGGIIIASPLPDELGIALMGLTSTRLIVLVPISFSMNALGIALIWFGAQVF